MADPDAVQWIGIVSALVLLITLLRQIRVQWTSRDVEGVSGWLFAGQMCASAGFLCYSWLIGDTVFIFINVMGLTTALLGQGIYWYKRRLLQAGDTKHTGRRTGRPRPPLSAAWHPRRLRRARVAGQRPVAHQAALERGLLHPRA
ncbi:SemiSWEET family transporter [Chitiniphilus shinanonensis]|uniref:SemiSWEET family transporter n=1 Tax=Chitiniphilus shinanonensis TaxID=553088 RepID=UPI00036E2B51|nr:SemiSWEET family transporter [Chitiniphilus shinanonensis]